MYHRRSRDAASYGNLDVSIWCSQPSARFELAYWSTGSDSVRCFLAKIRPLRARASTDVRVSKTTRWRGGTGLRPAPQIGLSLGVRHQLVRPDAVHHFPRQHRVLRQHAVPKSDLEGRGGFAARVVTASGKLNSVSRHLRSGRDGALLDRHNSSSTACWT